MTLSLVKSPAAVSLVGNDIPFKINTDNQFSAEGTKAYLGLIWSAGDAAADGFTLNYGVKNPVEVAFVCAASPDDSGTQYPAYVSGTTDAYMESLVPYLNANYYLRTNFFVEWNGSALVVVIRARNNGAEYSLTFTAGTSNATEDSNNAGTDDTARVFYGIICRSYLKGSGVEDDIFLGEDRLYPDILGVAYFKIQEYLKSQLTFDFEWPEPTDTFLFLKGNAIKPFFVEYAETYDGVNKKVISTRDSATLAILGGISRNAQAELNENETTWWEQFLYKLDWMTNQPREITVGKTQPVKLSVLVWKAGVTSLKLKVNVYYTDGTSGSLTDATIAASQYNIFECILSYQKLGLGALAKEVSYYKAWVTDQDDNRLTVDRYFYVDPAYRDNERMFIFQNSIGRPETVRFTGVTETEVEHDRNDFSLIAPEAFTWRDHETNNFDNTEVEKIKFNSGYLNDLAKYPKQFADYLREFYLSPAIWEVVNNRLYPIRITGKKQFINNTDETLSYIEFEAERGYQDKYYTRDENIHPSQGWETKFENEEYLNP